MQRKVKCNYLLSPSHQPSKKNLDKPFKTTQEKKTGLQDEVYKEYVNEYLGKMDVFKLSGLY